MTIRLRSNVLTFLSLSAVALIALALHQNQKLQPVEGLVLRAFVPAQTMFSHLGQSIQDTLDTAHELRSLQAENQRLRQQTNDLLLSKVHLAEVEQQNLQLRELLDFKQKNPDYTVQLAEVIGRSTPATVIGRDPSNLVQSLLLNQGTADGVRQGQAVVTARGLVGRITEADLNWSKVLLLTDSNSRVNGLLQSSRATGIVAGRQGKLYLRYVPQGEEIVPNDIVVTSGLGGYLPKGLVIGQVQNVQQRDVDMFQEAEIRSFVDFSRLELVIVLQDFTPLQVQP
ncbi:MAG: rod shape-determining protein MreC [Chloroflexi bacterium]|nr:rod shape-determining protein MreC [Chloroflexota bacterium]